MLLLGLIEIPVWFLLLLGATIALYSLGKRNHDYFQKRGITGPKPWPFIGTLYTFFSGDLYTLHLKLKEKHGKVYGMLSGSTPEYVIFDEEMLSEITVKQFHNFIDRRSRSQGEPLFDNMLTALRGEKWKHVRNQVSPAFTTGKLRAMSDEIYRSGQALAEKLISMKTPFEARKQAGAFGMDVIASTAFGLRINTHQDENNPFVKSATKLTDFNIRGVAIFLILFCPKAIPYLKKLGFSIFDPKAAAFFKQVFHQTLEGRKEGDQIRADFLQLMVKAQQGHDIRDQEEEEGEEGEGEEEGEEEGRKPSGKLTGLSKDEILANSMVFLMAGYDTAATALSQLMYLLACNPHCQQRVLEELDNLLQAKEKIDYDSAMKMYYLDQCIQETLRLYPPAFMINRQVTTDTDVCGIKMEKGSVITIPVIGIHHDPDIWPDPEKFDPDRFSPDKKADINPFHWMPFGYGPRHCIGMRLALFEIKVAIATLLRTHKLVTCEKTEIPLKMSKRKMMKPENGAWLTLEKRADK